MMPTSPRSPLKFRTVGFPQYGFKAGLSGGASPGFWRLKSLPTYAVSGSVYLHPSDERRLHRSWWDRCPANLVARPAVREVSYLSTPGALARAELFCLGRHHLFGPIRQSRGHTETSRQRRLYPVPSLCGSASATHETFQAFTADLSQRAVDNYPGGSQRFLPITRRRVPEYSRCRKDPHPQLPPLPAMLGG